MKKLSIFFVSAIMLFTMSLPAGAVQESYRHIDVIDTEFGPVEVESVLIIHQSKERSNTKSADAVQTYKYGGKVIAEVTLSATFGYDGKTAWVTSASGSRTTYDGWSYSGQSISKSGGTATLTATLSHSLHRSISVNVSLTCSPTGQIS